MPAASAAPTTSHGLGPLRRRGRLPSCGPAGARRGSPGCSFVGSVALRARGHQAGLELTQEGGVVGELVGQLRLHASLGGRALGELLELVGAAVDQLVGLGRHFLIGGCSPVATRQIREAARREAIVARAPSAA